MWDAVRAKLEENKKIGEVVGHRGGQPHFLYGKVFCGECGAPMTRRTVNGPGGEKIKTWICREKRKGSGCTCLPECERRRTAGADLKEDHRDYGQVCHG